MKLDFEIAYHEFWLGFRDKDRVHFDNLTARQKSLFVLIYSCSLNSKFCVLLLSIRIDNNTHSAVEQILLENKVNKKRIRIFYAKPLY